jgi:hypothetical protein
MPEGKYRGISLSKETIAAIEKFIDENPEAGYTSIADFISDAIRERFEQLGVYPGRISLIDVDPNELGALLYDKDLRRTVQVYMHHEGIQCGECNTGNCKHVKFALKVPEVQELIQKKKKEGWKLPDL